MRISGKKNFPANESGKLFYFPANFLARLIFLIVIMNLLMEFHIGVIFVTFLAGKSSF